MNETERKQAALRAINAVVAATESDPNAIFSANTGSQKTTPEGLLIRLIQQLADLAE